MDILYIEMKALHMMNKLHIFPPRLRLISLDFWVDTLLSKLCNLYFVWYGGTKSEVRSFLI